MHTHPVMIPGSSSFLQWLDQYSRGKDLGLYVHIPFCQKRCHFCAFYLHIHREDKVRDFLMAIDQEISLYARDGGLSQCSLSTVYLGGGTPTSLSPHQLHGLFTTIKEAFRVHPQAEITVEATPDTVTKDHLQTFRALGVNRLSFGAQTFEEREWERL